jgi:hypothetical protein
VKYLFTFVHLFKEMNCEIVKLEEFSGNEASVYSIYIEEEKMTLYDRFIIENKAQFLTEITDINKRLINIGKIGARENFFKINEGNPGDGVCALYDNPNSNLRLYCIRYATSIVLIGGGGYKPKTIRALQEDEKLNEENDFLKQLSKEIKQRMLDKELKFTTNYLDFEGDINFNFNDDE